jgi:hypothetical protein
MFLLEPKAEEGGAVRVSFTVTYSEIATHKIIKRKNGK